MVCNGPYPMIFILPDEQVNYVHNCEPVLSVLDYVPEPLDFLINWQLIHSITPLYNVYLRGWGDRGAWGGEGGTGKEKERKENCSSFIALTVLTLGRHFAREFVHSCR